jgi:polyhydroxyalkanoate synthesis repressor PhaR
VRVIKRYSNRKLYDTQAGEYITLDALAELVQNGEEVSVIDHDTGADLTAVTLMQAMYEREKKIGGMLPKAILTGLIQAGNIAAESIQRGLTSLMENPSQAEAEIKRRLDVLLADGLIAAEEFQRWTELLLGARWKPEEKVAKQNPVTDLNNPDEQRVAELRNQVEDLERQIAELQS